MSLPTLSLPTFEVVLPSTKKKMTLRPYTVKEQTILLRASNADSVEEAVLGIKQILEACIISPANFNLNSLTMFDLQFLFLRLRAKSVDEVIDLSYRCKNIVEDKECGKVNTFSVNILDVAVHFPEASNQTIQLSNGIGIKLKYQTLDSVKIIEKYGEINTPEALIDAVAHDIEYVFDSEKIYDEFTQDELKLFVSSFKINDANKLYEFYANQPDIQHTVKFSCSKCGYTEDILVKGVESFLE